MKVLVAVILTTLLAFVSGIYMSWWGLALAAFIVGIVVRQHVGLAFLSGFLGVFILWAGLAWWFDVKNEGNLSVKIAELLPLGGNPLLLILVTGFVGGLVGGMGAMSGSFLRSSYNKAV